MRFIAIFAILLCGFTAAAQDTRQRSVSITIDDLPAMIVGNAPYLPNSQRVTKDILDVLKQHRAPAVGFVNEGKLWSPREREARIGLLKQWVEAGMVLGNHTYSHPDFNRLTVAEFEQQIASGDVISRRLMKSRQPYQLYFRHPMTHTGDTREKKEAIEKFLAARGYKIAPHTIENNDFIYNVPYALAKRNGDKGLVKRLRDSYLEHTLAATAFAEQISRQIFGREVPQTLLIHANELNADCLDELLQSFAARGYKFVTLDTAMADPAYRTRDDYVGTTGPTWFWRWNVSMGRQVSFATDPEPPKWVVDLYRES